MTNSRTLPGRTLNTCDGGDNGTSELLINDELNAANCDIHDSDTLLDVNTSSHCKATCFDNGLYDAEQMMQLSPSLPEGYLRAGELYSLLGYQRRAMNVYKQGLDNVDRKHHHLLQKRYDSAKAKDEVRIDIPGLSPYDITSTIAEHLAGETCLTLLDVSRTWRSKFSQCPSIWSTIIIKPFEGIYAESDIMRLAQHVGPHILRCTLYLANESYTETLFRGMIDGYFSNLAHLSLMYFPAYSDSGLMAGLGKVSETLVKLDLILIAATTVEGGDATLPYKAILSICPNLEYFRYEHYKSDVSRAVTGSLGSTYTSKLTELQLISSHIELVNVEDILRSSPDLQSLELDGCTSAVVNVALDKCRKLKFISLDDNVQYIDYSWINKNRSSNPSEAGICTLTATIGDPGDFMRLFTEHRTTLEALSLQLTDPPLDRWELFSASGNLSNLIFLGLQCSDPAASIAAATLIRKSPSLLRLQLICRLSENDLMSAIVGAPHLRELRVSNTIFSEQNLRTLFQGLAAKGTDQSTLRSITLSEVHCDARFAIDNALDCLPDIATLREVEITRCQLVTEAAIVRFCEQLRSHPSIEVIEFEALDCVTDASLKTLAAIKGLRSLSLAYIQNVTEEGVKVLMEDSSAKLEIHGCAKVPDVN